MNESADALKLYSRRAWLIFGAVVAVTLLMVTAHYVPLPNPAVGMGLILAAAGVNACLVAAHLMHLLSERVSVWVLIAFTVFFFVGLMVLSAWASQDHPGATLSR